MRMMLEDVARAAGASLLHPAGQAPVVTGVASDSRAVKPGDLFVCVPGERTDGHDHAAEAVRAGAVAVLAERDPFEGEVNARVLLTPVLLADNSVAALGRLGHAWRAAFRGKVVGVTGTAGKTTLKELLAHILAGRGATARNPLNLNTQIGLPVSMLGADGDEAFWVMEAGISHAGDMDELGPVLEPDLAVILNVGAGHVQGLGGKGVARCKAALLKYLAPGAQALVSADYPDLVREARALCPAAVYFSTTGKQMPYRAAYLGLGEDGRGRYRLRLDGESLDVACSLPGPYGAGNGIAAAAAAHLLGLSAEEIARGLEGAALPAQRFARLSVPGWTVIDDSYNANPLSCARMLEAAAELARDRALVCVMGEMLELGDEADREHVELGRALAVARAVFWLGGHADEVREGLEKEHFAGLFRPLARPEDFLPAFADWDNARSDRDREGLMLFKGSRGNRLERLVNAFTESRVAHAV